MSGLLTERANKSFVPKGNLDTLTFQSDPGAPKLKVKSLRKTYGSVVALAEADLTIYKGEFVTLLGPSGSGKTTLLMAIAGLNEPDSGEVWIDDKLATYVAPHKRDLGVVFQNYALFPHMTIAENIAFPLRMRKQNSKAIEASVQDVLELVHLRPVADRYPAQLSGGQQQRIALARVLVYEPSIILMDEPLGALDKNLRNQMQLEIKRLHAKLRTTILYVTHDQEEAMTISDRICLMNNTRIEQLGSPEELYFNPISLFAAGFLGESNLFDSQIVSRQGTRARMSICDDCHLEAETNAPVGAVVRLMVRPESLRISSESLPGYNCVRGVVSDVILSGPLTHVFVQLANGVEVKVASLTDLKEQRIAKGEVVPLSWSVPSMLVFDSATQKRL